MSQPKIIAICGLMRSGKDTIANYLSEKYGYQNVKIAETLKKMMGLLFGISSDQLEGDSKDVTDPHWGITPRSALQFFGTEVMQIEVQRLLPDIGRTFWISSFVKNLHKTSPQSPLYVISDMRFVHEYEYLIKHFHKDNVLVLKVKRNPASSTPQSHVSEMEFELIKEDVLIYNDDSIKSLQNKIDNLMVVRSQSN